MPPPNKSLQLVKPNAPSTDAEGYVDDLEDLLRDEDDEDGDEDEDDVFDDDDQDDTFDDGPTTISPDAVMPAGEPVRQAAADGKLAVPRKLVAQWTKDNGVPRVAWFEGNKRVEAWRHPTKVEWEKLKKARIVRGGVGEATTAVDAQVVQPKPWKKWLVWGGSALGVGLAGWWAYKAFVQRDNDAEIEDVED